MDKNKNANVKVKTADLPEKRNGIASIVLKVTAVIVAIIIAVNVTYIYRYGTPKTFGSIPYGYTIFTAVSDTVDLTNAKIVVSSEDANKTVSGTGSRILVWTKYGSYSGTLTFNYNNRTVAVPFLFINTNNWHRNKVTLTVNIVGDDVAVELSCRSTGLDRSKYADLSSEKYKIDNIKSISLMR